MSIADKIADISDAARRAERKAMDDAAGALDRANASAVAAHIAFAMLDMALCGATSALLRDGRPATMSRQGATLTLMVGQRFATYSYLVEGNCIQIVHGLWNSTASAELWCLDGSTVDFPMLYKQAEGRVASSVAQVLAS